jgi:hypothetical protein
MEEFCIDILIERPKSKVSEDTMKRFTLVVQQQE